MQAQRRCARARDARARERFKSDERIMRALIRGGLMGWESKELAFASPLHFSRKLAALRRVLGDDGSLA